MRWLFLDLTLAIIGRNENKHSFVKSKWPNYPRIPKTICGTNVHKCAHAYTSNLIGRGVQCGIRKEVKKGGGGVERGGKEEQMFIRSTTPLCPQLLLLPPFIISLVIVASYLKKPVWGCDGMTSLNHEFRSLSVCLCACVCVCVTLFRAHTHINSVAAVQIFEYLYITPALWMTA